MCVPDYHEFTVKILYKELIEDETVSKFMPDYKEGQLPDKNFFHKLVCSIYPHQMYNFIYEAQKKRAINNADQNEDLIEIAPEIVKEIKEVVMLPSKYY